MKRFWHAALAAPLLLAALSILPARATTGTAVFDDDFSGPTIDASKWIPNEGSHAPNSYDVSLASQDRVDSNGLHLTGDRIPGNSTIISGEVTSRLSFLYGHFDVFARLPHSDGFWPGIWLRNFDKQGFMNGEIDLVEAFGSKPHAFQTTLHKWYHGTDFAFYCALLGWKPKNYSCQELNFTTPNLTSGYHHYQMDWSPHQIVFSLDGQPYYTLTKDIPQVPMNLVLSLAAGSTWDGPPTKNTVFPTYFDVRSVHIVAYATY